MPANPFGDLYKAEIVNRLQKLGHPVKNVHQLNLILEEMNLVRKSGRYWMTTKEGVKLSIYRSPGTDADIWHPEIVRIIHDYLRNK